MWRAGGSVAAAIESGQLGAACPLSLWSTMLAAPVEEATRAFIPPGGRLELARRSRRHCWLRWQRKRRRRERRRWARQPQLAIPACAAGSRPSRHGRARLSLRRPRCCRLVHAVRWERPRSRIASRCRAFCTRTRRCGRRCTSWAASMAFVRDPPRSPSCDASRRRSMGIRADRGLKWTRSCTRTR